MPRFETDALMAISHYLPEIAKQLAIANKLKVLELKKGVVGNTPELQEIEDEIC